MAVRNRALRHLRRLLDDTAGATATEYALIVGVVSIVAGFLLPEIKAALDGLFATTQSGLRAAVLNMAAPVAR